MLRDTVRRNPDYPYAEQSLAIALGQRGREAPAEMKKSFQEAESVLHALLEIQPGFPGGHLALGQLLLTDGEIPAAVVDFTRTLQLSENWAEAHRGLATCYTKLGNRALADEHMRAAAALRSGK